MGANKIKIVGIGEGGARAIGKMIEAGIGQNKNVDFVCVGKDENILLISATPNNIFLNRDAPTIYKSIAANLRDAKLVILVAGLGGTAATGALPRIISFAKNNNAATIAFANLPFVLESLERKKNAEYALNCLRDVDTAFILPAEKFFLFRLYQKEISVGELFEVANEVFSVGTKILIDMTAEKDEPLKLGKAAFGYGYGATALEAIKNSVKFPALEPEELSRAKKIFVRITSGNDTPAKNFIRKIIAHDAKLFWQVDSPRSEKILAAIVFNKKEV